MARRQVLEIQCARCERKELIDKPPGGGVLPDKVPEAFSAVMADGTKVMFDDLCSPCTDTVKSYLEMIGKKIEGLSPLRQKKSKDEVKEENPFELAKILEQSTDIPVAKKKGHAPTGT